ncbi:hypothetical protein ACFT7S_02105 [Streptomyces sp. NPDC057136]|uniref:hypothetical protein n=1 Tax=Streptomyces sp. NPDC057136 TaxID=3346029 RepID=UPI00363271C4
MKAHTAIVCSVADQGVTALTNILVLVAAARLSTVADFARFSAVYLVFTVLLGASGAYTGQPLVLRRAENDDTRGACRSAVAFTLLAATALGALLAAVCLLVPGDTARALMMLGLVLPAVLGQDAMRYAFSTLRLPHLALTCDVLRLVCVLGSLAVQPYGAGAARLVTVWGLSALPALLLSAVLLHRRTAGTPLQVRALFRQGHLGRRFVVEFGVGNATSQLSVLGLGAVGNPLVVGALRGATTLFGPLNVLYTSATSFGPPLLGRLGSRRRQVRATAGLAAVLAATAALWATVLALLPDAAGRELLGDTWPTAAALLPATGSQYAAMAVGTCGLLALRMLDPRTTLSIQVVFSLAAVAFLAGGYALGGVTGAAWGLCLGSVCKAVATWTRVVRLHGGDTADRESVSASAVRSGS